MDHDSLQFLLGGKPHDPRRRRPRSKGAAKTSSCFRHWPHGQPCSAATAQCTREGPIWRFLQSRCSNALDCWPVITADPLLFSDQGQTLRGRYSLCGINLLRLIATGTGVILRSSSWLWIHMHLSRMSAQLCTTGYSTSSGSPPPPPCSQNNDQTLQLSHACMSALPLMGFQK